MNVCLLTWWGDSLTYTVARALAHNGHRVDILITDRERHLKARWGISARIREIDGVRLMLDPDEISADRHEWLIVQSMPTIAAHRGLIVRLARTVEQVTLISFGDRLRSWRSAVGLQLAELRTLLPVLGRVKTVAYKDGYHAIDVFALLAKRAHVGFDVHSKFLHVDSLYQRIHAQNWQPESSRTIGVNFVGSRDPQRRGTALDKIDAYLDRSGMRASQGQRIMWRVYSDTEPGALPESEFVDILSNSDFTLAPPGHSLVTHRPIESMLRGSVPILNAAEAALYEMNLRDGENCLLVREDDWAAAVARALTMDQPAIRRMRANIQRMLPAQLQYGPLSAAICGRLGAPA
jgi:hypothetical protein